MNHCRKPLFSAIAAALCAALGAPGLAAAQDDLDLPHRHQQLREPTQIVPHSYEGTHGGKKLLRDGPEAAGSELPGSTTKPTEQAEASSSDESAEQRSGGAPGKPAPYNASKYRDAPGNPDAAEKFPVLQTDHKPQPASHDAAHAAASAGAAAGKTDPSGGPAPEADAEHRHYMAAEQKANPHEPGPNQPSYLLQPASGIAASNCWIRLMPPESPSAVYFALGNQSKAAVSLTAVDLEGFQETMMHETVKDENGSSGMEMVNQVKLDPGKKVSFEPGGYHVMAMDPGSDLKAGQDVQMHYRFSSGEVLDSTCRVQSAKAQKFGDE